MRRRMDRPIPADPLVVGKRQPVDLVGQIATGGGEAAVDLVPDFL
jgi:hypothetical protein